MLKNNPPQKDEARSMKLSGKNKNNNSYEYISLQDATKFCSYSQEYLSLRARQGKLKAVKLGRNWVTTREWIEKYIAKIFQAWGYETLTDQTILGNCVSHEIDIIAWNNEKLIMVEAKFHNELGTKSDVKIALYIKARFEDLSINLYDSQNRF